MGGVLGFTGHRPDRLGGYNERNPLAEAVKAWGLRTIARFLVAGYDTFITGGALGFDTWMGEILMADIQVQLPDGEQRLFPRSSWQLRVYAPFMGQAHKWPPHAQERYMRLLKAADEVRYISEKYGPDAMHKRNRAIVIDCNALVACFDGSRAGGTWHAMHYAETRHRPVLWYNPRTEEEQWLNRNR